jgi:hypothetical protein
MTGQFEQTLDDFQKDMKGSRVSIEQMLVVLNNRGFGPLILIPCLIEMLPTGMIPGVPSLCATLIILISAQIVMGRRYPWIPKRLRKKKFDHHQLNEGLDKIRPFVRWTDRRTKERWRFLASDPLERMAALAIIALALTMYPLEFVPFASSIPAFIISLFAIGFVVKDGLLLLIAWGIAIGGSFGIGYILYSLIFNS